MNEQKKLNLSFIGKFFEAISFVGKPFSVSHLVLVSGVKAIASVHSTWYVRKIIEENVEGIISLSVCLSAASPLCFSQCRRYRGRKSHYFFFPSVGGDENNLSEKKQFFCSLLFTISVVSSPPLAAAALNNLISHILYVRQSYRRYY